MKLTTKFLLLLISLNSHSSAFPGDISAISTKLHSEKSVRYKTKLSMWRSFLLSSKKMNFLHEQKFNFIQLCLIITRPWTNISNLNEIFNFSVAFWKTFLHLLYNQIECKLSDGKGSRNFIDKIDWQLMLSNYLWLKGLESFRWIKLSERREMKIISSTKLISIIWRGFADCTMRSIFSVFSFQFLICSAQMQVQRMKAFRELKHVQRFSTTSDQYVRKSLAFG